MSDPVEKNARSAIELYDCHGAGPLCEVLAENAHPVALHQLVEKINQLGRSDIAKVILEGIR
jgi:hypothetical protein